MKNEKAVIVSNLPSRSLVTCFTGSKLWIDVDICTRLFRRGQLTKCLDREGKLNAILAVLASTST